MIDHHSGERPRGRIRVITQNLWGRRGSWTERRTALTGTFATLAPDLVALPESISTDDYDQVRDVLGDGYHVVHQRAREPGDGADVERGQGHSLASRWPVAGVHEVDLHVTPRTEGFACGLLAAEVDAPEPVGPLIFGFHNPSWQPSFAYERELQAVVAARFLEDLSGNGDRHVILAADLDADPVAASARFWTGHQSLDGMSVCYRDAWASRHPGEAGDTFGAPENPLVVDWDWPFRRIDYLLIRCGDHGGPTLRIDACERVFDAPVDGIWASDHFGVMAELAVPTASRPA
jgi:endonuclease/exonuclease/phosphatase family metal-dependent hydrolase